MRNVITFNSDLLIGPKQSHCQAKIRGPKNMTPALKITAHFQNEVLVPKNCLPVLMLMM